MPRFFAMTSRGLTDALAEELERQGVERVLKGMGGVYFDSNWAGCYRVHLQSRLATRVLLPVLDFPAYKPEELYHHIQRHDFTKYISVEGRISVDAVVKECGEFHDQRFVAMKVKDAIVDQFRDKCAGRRPDVDSEDPDLVIVVRGYKNQFAVSVDTTGEPLFKRGYRVEAGDAPIKENLAAGLLQMTGWRGDCPIVDPMCGSGTFLIEAALMALHVPVGTLRRGFAFQRHHGFQSEAWDNEVNKALDLEKPRPDFQFYGFDISKKAISQARRNAERAGVDDLIDFQSQAFETLEPPAEKGLLIVNPPYGKRLLEKNEAIEVFRNLGFLLKTKFKGWEGWILSSDPELSSALKLKADKKFRVYNGPLECRFLKYNLY